MFIETVPNRASPPAVLLRESYRDENGRAQKRTLANLSKLPGNAVAVLKAILKGGTLIGTGPIVRWRNMATAGITEATACRSSTACSVPARDYRSRSRCSPATRRTRRR
jgi:hypothetical protein